MLTEGENVDEIIMKAILQPNRLVKVLILARFRELPHSAWMLWFDFAQAIDVIIVWLAVQ